MLAIGSYLVVAYDVGSFLTSNSDLAGLSLLRQVCRILNKILTLANRDLLAYLFFIAPDFGDVWVESGNAKVGFGDMKVDFGDT